MNANLVPFANKVLDLEFKRKAFQELGGQTRALELHDAVTACHAAYGAALPPAPAPAGDVIAMLQTMRDEFTRAFDEARNSFTGIEGRLAGIEGRLTAVEGKITGVHSQLATIGATMKQDHSIS